jgi:hypothetical protein
MVANMESNIAGPDATRYDVFNGVEVILYKKAGAESAMFCFVLLVVMPHSQVPEAAKL